MLDYSQKESTGFTQRVPPSIFQGLSLFFSRIFTSASLPLTTQRDRREEFAERPDLTSAGRGIISVKQKSGDASAPQSGY